MSISLHGVGVSRGIAMGRAHILHRDQLEVSEYCLKAEYIVEEVRRFEQAVLTARQQLRAIRDHIPPATAADIAAFIDTHLLMLEDSALTQEPARLITERRCNAEWALKIQRDALVAVFEEMDDPYLRTRKDDVDHVVNRMQRILLNQGPMRHEVPDSRLRGYIVLADDLTPADTVLMQHHGIAAFATEHGGPTSHTAILARSLGIPSIVGLHQARRYVREEDLVIIDGISGVLLVDPDPETIRYYEGLQQQERVHFAELIKLKGAPAITGDGIKICLEANIELPKDFESVLNVGALGVGLYRTEYLYMNRDRPPAEEEQFQVYSQALHALQGMPITIRTLDLGADKQVDSSTGRERRVLTNQALGLRAVRLCLKEPGLFLPQLRAIIRASALGPVRLLIPMLSNLQELYQVLAIIAEIRADFRSNAVLFDPDMRIGGMIEVPAAALCADLFAKQLDFLSIGTNDLIQYTLAVDRVDDEVSYLYDPVHPAVLRLIRITIQAARDHKKPVVMCGEMASDLRYVRLLLGLGLRDFSVHPAVLLEVKKIINNTRLEEVMSLSEQVLAASSSSEINDLLGRINAGLN
ncbi:MAG: phosphoenolpyruvate--protein phosphotransferase [Gammaproteobacteria bacterium]|nr:phosphoenolpyruvate--protein phosphotransferase [Gammaproteobacteria bacterium]